MASSSQNKEFSIRAAAITTNAEVAGTSFDLNNAKNGHVSIQVDFTLGSLTNGIFKVYVSQDNSTFWTLFGPTGAALTQTLTASSAIVIPVFAPGFKFLRVSVTGTGTVTSSSATVVAKYLRR